MKTAASWSGMTRRQNPQADTLIDRVDESQWGDCPMGINAREKQDPPRTRGRGSELKTIRHVQFRVNGKLHSGVTPGSSHARQVLKALKLADHRPPSPPQGHETTT